MTSRAARCPGFQLSSRADVIPSHHGGNPSAGQIALPAILAFGAAATQSIITDGIGANPATEQKQYQGNHWNQHGKCPFHRRSPVRTVFYLKKSSLRRSHTRTGCRVAGAGFQLLVLLDGMEARGQIFVLATTNRPEHVDPALRRPGRFDQVVWMGLPDERRLDRHATTHQRSAGKAHMASADVVVGHLVAAPNVGKRASKSPCRWRHDLANHRIPMAYTCTPPTKNLNDIGEIAPACRRRGNVFAHSWAERGGKNAKKRANVVRRYDCPMRDMLHSIDV